jgi:hypothetical protein
MRSLLLATTMALATGLLALPADAAYYRYSSRAPAYNTVPPNTGYYVGNGGFGSGPYWQGEPTDWLPIWRNGYYQGNDPDQFIRSQIMRDPTNVPRGRR